MIDDYQLTLDKLLIQTLHRRSVSEIVYGKSRYTWPEFYHRIKRLASGLEQMGVKRGDRVAVVDFDTNRYLEAYFAVPMMGAVLHTVNIRLPPEHISYTMAHAEDNFVLLREDFAPLGGKIIPGLKSLKGVVTMSDSGSGSPLPSVNSVFYDDVLRSGDQGYDFPALEENQRATLFYTSGTTGMPKGVWFTHRQLVLHTMAVQAALSNSALGSVLSMRDVVLPCVPFFHVHSWGIPYVAATNGQKLVLAGRYEAGSILELVAREGVTFSYMVPTLLNMILADPSLQAHSAALAKWKVLVGGSALSRELAVGARRAGIAVMCGYGLSETAPVLTLATPTDSHTTLSPEELFERVLLRTGLPLPLADVRVVDGEMREVPRDNSAVGEIVVRAPWLTREYYKDEEGTKKLWAGGWLHTGDMAVVDGDGYLKIVDRMKDAIKSGGEWIPTIILEDLILRHPAVSEAAVIGAREEKWGERPVALLSLRQGRRATEDELRTHMHEFAAQGKIARFWLPDRYFVMTEELPKSSTGKIDKKALREKFSGALVAGPR